MNISDLPDVRWRKSSRSGGQGGNCVEVASLPPVVAVRDSKATNGPHLALSAAAWRAFTDRVQACEFDLDRQP